MVKNEATGAYLEVVKAVSDADMAVMAHIGVKLQRIRKIGRLKTDATAAQMAAKLVSLAEHMVNREASSLMIEGPLRKWPRL
jgi:ketopantoate hydroxymethyltransferase